jgi:hypothetical protein
LPACRYHAQEQRVKYDDHCRKSARVAVPKGLAERRWGGAERLAAALARGEVQQYVGDDKVTYCCWAEHEVGSANGKRNKTTAAGSKEIDSDQVSALTTVLDSLNWDFDIGRGQGNRKLTAGDTPPQAMEKVVEALAALRKAGAESKALLSKLQELRPAAAASNLAWFPACLQELLGHTNKLNHVESFQQYPDCSQLSLAGLKTDLSAAAAALVAMREASEVAKTFVKLG